MIPTPMNRSVRTAWAALVAVAAVALPGCDLFDPGGPSYGGVVVDAETGAPVEGIQMSLQVSGGGFGTYHAVAEDLTDADGRFRLRDPLDRASRATLFVNSPGSFDNEPSPYNPLYSGGPVGFYDFDERLDLRVELRRIR